MGVKFIYVGAIIFGLFFSNQLIAGELKPYGAIIHTDIPYPTSEQFPEKKQEKRIQRLERKFSRVKEEKKEGLQYQLASEYFMQGRYLFFEELEVYYQAWDECFYRKGCNVDAIEPNHERSNAANHKSIEQFEIFINSYPSSSERELALLYMARLHKDMEENKEAIRLYTQYIKTYPASSWVPDVYIALGELMEDEDVSSAKLYRVYQAILRHPESLQYGHALYKMAWLHYEMDEPEKAIQSLLQLLKYSQETQHSNTDLLDSYEELALKEGLRIAKEMNRPELMKNAFQDAGKLEYYEGRLREQ